jgi:hypothetical protein
VAGLARDGLLRLAGPAEAPWLSLPS